MPLEIKGVTEEAIKSPSHKAYIRFVSFLVGSLTRDKIKEEFVNIARSLGLKDEDIRWREMAAVAVGKYKDSGRIIAKMDQGMDVYTYQIWFPERTDFEFRRGGIADAEILVYDREMTGLEIEGTLGGREGYGEHCKGWC